MVPLSSMNSLKHCPSQAEEILMKSCSGPSNYTIWTVMGSSQGRKWVRGLEQMNTESVGIFFRIHCELNQQNGWRFHKVARWRKQSWEEGGPHFLHDGQGKPYKHKHVLNSICYRTMMHAWHSMNLRRVLKRTQALFMHWVFMKDWPPENDAFSSLKCCTFLSPTHHKAAKWYFPDIIFTFETHK